MKTSNLPEHWRQISQALEATKRKTEWASEQYLSLCAVQSTLERCADELHEALATASAPKEQP